MLVTVVHRDCRQRVPVPVASLSRVVPVPRAVWGSCAPEVAVPGLERGPRGPVLRLVPAGDPGLPPVLPGRHRAGPGLLRHPRLGPGHRLGHPQLPAPAAGAGAALTGTPGSDTGTGHRHRTPGRDTGTGHQTGHRHRDQTPAPDTGPDTSTGHRHRHRTPGHRGVEAGAGPINTQAPPTAPVCFSSSARGRAGR